MRTAREPTLCSVRVPQARLYLCRGCLAAKAKGGRSTQEGCSHWQEVWLPLLLCIAFADHYSPRKSYVETHVNSASQPGETSQPHVSARELQSSKMSDLAILDDTLSLQRHRHCRHVGRMSALDVSLLGLSDFDSRNETSTDAGDVRRVSDKEFFFMHSDTTFPSYEDELQSLFAVQQVVAPHGPALIDIYFANVHPSFPIIQKQVFLNRHRHGDRQFNSALLAGIYLLALQWWSSDPVLAQQQKPSEQALEELGFRSLSVAMQRPKLSALQAGLLLLQRPHSNGWNLTVQLVALAQDLGLHLDCSSWSIPLWERRLRKRLAWALYIQDKWAGLVNGRPSHIQASDWVVPQLTVRDFNEDVTADEETIVTDEEDQDVERSRIVFTEMIELTGIMANVIDTFYTQKAIAEFERAGKSATQMILIKAKPVQLKLKEWFAKLPAMARMDSFTAGKLSPNGTFHPS